MLDTTSLIKLNRPPSSTRWDFVAERNGYKFWRSNTGKLFAEFQTPNGDER